MIDKRKEMGNVEFKQIFKEKDYKLNLRKETQHFIIYYTEIDKACIDKVSDVLEDNYNRITIIFNQQLEDKLIIEIHSDINQRHTPQPKCGRTRAGERRQPSFFKITN